ncbi:MAG: hypothetical protein HY718_12125 [Planctomycetes bacterium]|nr:hypothetical protein [Planctomycetota bacterium]
MRIASPLLVVLIASVTLIAQGPATQPADDAVPPVTQPAGAEAMQATIIKIVGNVVCALPGPDGKPGEFKPAKVGDKLPAGAMIQTRLRSSVMLAFGDDAVVLVDRVTLASIDQFHRTADTKKVQLGLGHGLIRGATVETTLRSDMTISSPVATLSKRGTIDFGMRYEPGTGRYTVFLNQEGLVEALDHLANLRRNVQPGQYVTQALARWIETLTMDRYVSVTDAWGTTSAEQSWSAHFGGSGTGVVDPGGGSTLYTASFNASDGFTPSSLTTVPPIPPTLPPAGEGTLRVVRPEGNFGTGFGAAH